MSRALSSTAVSGGKRRGSSKKLDATASTSSAVSRGTEPIDDDREGTGLQAAIQVGMLGGQAGADQHRDHLVTVGGPLRVQASNVVVHETGDSEEVVIAEFDYDGQITTTGRSFRVSNIQVLRVRKGQIVSSRDYHNHLAIAAALGQLHELLSSLTHQDSA